MIVMRSAKEGSPLKCWHVGLVSWMVLLFCVAWCCGTCCEVTGGGGELFERREDPLL